MRKLKFSADEITNIKMPTSFLLANADWFRRFGNGQSIIVIPLFSTEKEFINDATFGKTLVLEEDNIRRIEIEQRYKELFSKKKVRK